MPAATVLPGDTLPSTAKGEGTYTSSTQFSSLAGTLNTSSVCPASPAAPLPAVLDTVLARVTRITTRSASLEILAITGAETVVLPFAHQAQLRVQDVRATEVDKVVLATSFRVGDVVRAKVISLGDERSYYLSTAGDELGVVLGWSESGRLMAGVGWSEMLEVETGRRETRKVAKVV